MKKFISTKMKIFITSSLVGCIACFIAALVVLSNSGYNLSTYSDELGSFINNWEYDLNYNRHFDSSSVLFQDDISSITNINLDLSRFDVEVNTSTTESRFLVTGKFDKGFATGDCLSTTIDNNNLNIEASRSLIPNFNDIKFIVTIPSNYKGDLSISTANGDINLHNMTSKKVSIKSLNSSISLNDNKFDDIYVSLANGDINLNRNTGNNTVIESINSDIKINDIVKTLKINNTNDDIDLVIPAGLQSCKITSVNSNVDLHSNQTEGFKLSLKTVSGEFKQNIAGAAKLSQTGSFGNFSLVKDNEEATLDINTVSGDVSID